MHDAFPSPSAPTPSSVPSRDLVDRLRAAEEDLRWARSTVVPSPAVAGVLDDCLDVLLDRLGTMRDALDPVPARGRRWRPVVVR